MPSRRRPEGVVIRHSRPLREPRRQSLRLQPGDQAQVFSQRDAKTSPIGLPLTRRTAAALHSALDEIRDRFGSRAVSRAAVLGRDSRNAPWLLPGMRRTEQLPLDGRARAE